MSLQTGSCVESVMDIEYTAALTNPIPLSVWYFDAFSILDWLDSITSMRNPPLVHSVSFSLDDNRQVSQEYVVTMNTNLLKAAALGLSLLFASGDDGVWGRLGYGLRFHPEFPGSSPFVTSVGGTNFQTKSLTSPESSWSCSGGGFSEVSPIPPWQDTAVKDYLRNAYSSGVLPSTFLFNSAGRGYPDVSAIAGQTNPYCVLVNEDVFVGLSGTSGSTSVFAAMIAALNNVRMQLRKPPLGFLNPLLYANPQCFNDVRDRTRNQCLPGTEGFTAIPGWDAATGLGTLNYKCLEEVVRTL